MAKTLRHEFEYQIKGIRFSLGIIVNVTQL